MCVLGGVEQRDDWEVEVTEPGPEGRVDIRRVGVGSPGVAELTVVE